MFMPIEQKTCFILMFCQINNIFVPEDGDIVKDGVIAGVLVSIDNHTHIV